jgi:hypothetical protein
MNPCLRSISPEQVCAVFFYVSVAVFCPFEPRRSTSAVDCAVCCGCLSGAAAASSQCGGAGRPERRVGAPAVVSDRASGSESSRRARRDAARNMVALLSRLSARIHRQLRFYCQVPRCYNRRVAPGSSRSGQERPAAGGRTLSQDCVD